MRFVACIAFILCGCLAGASPARADHHPVLVVPGNPSAPVIINGHDASWAVVEGDWGLSRPGHVAPTVYYPFVPISGWHARPYYPFTGKRPRSGRKETIPPANRRLPPQAESYYRYWSNDAPPVPVDAGYPPVITVPGVRSLN